MPEIKGERIISGEITETPSSDGAISARLAAVRSEVYGIQPSEIRTAEIVEPDGSPAHKPIRLPIENSAPSKIARLNTTDSGGWSSLVSLREKRKAA